MTSGMVASRNSMEGIITLRMKTNIWVALSSESLIEYVLDPIATCAPLVKMIGGVGCLLSLSIKKNFSLETYSFESVSRQTYGVAQELQKTAQKAEVKYLLNFI